MPTPPSPTPQLPLKKGISLRWLPIGFILLQSLLYGFGDPISKSAYEVLPVYSLLTCLLYTSYKLRRASLFYFCVFLCL